MTARIPTVTTLAVPTSVASGAAIDISQVFEWDGFVTIAAAGTATYKVELSNDGANFVQDGADITASVCQKVTGRAKFLRIRCSAYTNGTPVGSHYGIKTLPSV
jgi:hypothetical protein